MANTYALKLKFGTASGEKTWTFNNANASVTDAQINALMNGMITNGSIYTYPPLTKSEATLVETSTTTFTLT